MESIVMSCFLLIITYILPIFIFCTLIYLICKLNRPLELIKEIPCLSKRKNLSNRFGECPPIYPNGWNAILESSDLSKNENKTISMFGKDLIVYRGSSGKCYVFDAYCPHLGANLGIGGTIVGDSIRCPFHGWVFDENGKCAHIPGIDCIKSMNAEIKKYETIEINDFICVWHHSSGEKPNWFPEKSDHIERKCNIYRGKTINIMNCHIQEIFENGADVQHFPIVHSAPIFLGNLLKRPRFYDFILNINHIDWSTTELGAGSGSSKHIMYMNINTHVKILGLTIMTSNSRLNMTPTLSRMNMDVYLLGRKTELCANMAVIQTIPLKLSFVNRIYSERGFVNWFLTRLLIANLLTMLERDSIIWSNKKYLSKPLFAKNESRLVEYRRWFKQFYSLNDKPNLSETQLSYELIELNNNSE